MNDELDGIWKEASEELERAGRELLYQLSDCELF